MDMDDVRGEATPTQFTKANIDLDMVRKNHAQIIQRRTTRRLGTKSAQRQQGVGGPAVSIRVTAGLSLEEAWSHSVHNLLRDHPDYFSCEEATLKDHGVIGQGRAAYKGISVCEDNNSDLREIYRIEYEPKISGGGSDGSFKQLCIAAGQLLRLCVVCNVLEVESVWMPGKLFEAICDKDTVDLLISHYRVRAVCTTVMTKAFHLKKISEHAKLYFQGRSVVYAAEAERSRIHLRSIFNVQKVLGRQRATDRRVIDDRIARAAIFMPQDFSRCKQKIRHALDSILASFDSHTVDHGVTAAVTTVFREGRTKNKWCMNLINLLVLTGGGQRPQVYTQLQLPSSSELTDMTQRAREQGFIEMSTVKEKTSRSLRMPFVLFPSYVLKYVRFHCSTVRPAIIDQAEKDESDLVHKSLLIHTENGHSLITPQVTKTFQAFLRMSEPTLADMTVMMLRSSYGTMMMHSYREKKIFPNLDEAAFLDTLSTQMNTSVDQLRSTYIGLDHTDYLDTAKALIRALAVTTNPDDTEETIDLVENEDDAPGFFA